MTDDVRGAILAHCADLREIARQATRVTDSRGIWHPHDREGETGLICATNGAADGAGCDRWAVVVAQAYDGFIKRHITTWDPAAIFDLVAGAEEMCEVHKGDSNLLHLVSGPNALGCKGCAYAEGAEWLRNTIGECPSLRLTAKMIGAKLA